MARVLLLVEHKRLRDTVRRALEAGGHEVAAASSKAVARPALRQGLRPNPGKADVVVSHASLSAGAKLSAAEAELIAACVLAGLSFMAHDLAEAALELTLRQ